MLLVLDPLTEACRTREDPAMGLPARDGIDKGAVSITGMLKFQCVSLESTCDERADIDADRADIALSRIEFRRESILRRFALVPATPASDPAASLPLVLGKLEAPLSTAMLYSLIVSELGIRLNAEDFSSSRRSSSHSCWWRVKTSSQRDSDRRRAFRGAFGFVMSRTHSVANMAQYVTSFHSLKILL
jgi:hypothetical protein